MSTKEKVLAVLDDWKSPTEISRETGIPLEEVRKALEELLEERRVWRDGPLYIDRRGRW